ncbi:MAG: type IV pilus assembly protein PilM [Phycisphaerales bacterium]
MPASNVCWGIEIGAGAIKALKLESDGDSFNVLDFAVVPHAKVLSTPGLDQDDAIRVALGTLTNQVDLSGAQIAISVPGHQSFARFAKLPPVEPKKVPDIVKFEAVQQIPFPLEDVEWDYQTFVSPDSPDIEVGIFAITRQRIMERLTMMGDVGMTPDVATISPVAAYNALAVDLEFTEKTPGTIILDIGAVATDMIIAEAGRVWVRTFPIGGHNFTEAIVNQFKISYGKAEKLKREAEQTKHARHVFQAMRPVFGDLVQEVQRSIGFYKSVHPDADLKRLIGLGSTFKLPGLRKYLKQQLQLDVYRLEQFKKLSVDGPRAGEFQAASLNFCTAYGLALQGLDNAALKANLMPVGVLREAMWKRKVPWFATAAGVAAAAAGAMFVRPLMDSSNFASAEPPGILRQVVRDAQALKTAADDAGVTGSATPDLRASTIVNLFEDRRLYARILDDTGTMLAAAGTRAPNANALRVASMNTEFVASGAEGARSASSYSAPAPDRYVDPRQAQSYSPTPSAFTAQAGVGGLPADVAERLQGKRYVRVETVIETTMTNEDAEALLRGTVERWLQDNETREGVEYDIVVSDVAVPWTFAQGETSRPGGRPGAARPGGRTPVGRPGSRPATTGAGSADVNRIAPLDKPEEEAPAITGTFTVVWYALLDKDAPTGDES